MDSSEKVRYSALSGYVGASNFKSIQESRVLVVGAGGIGCEILKNLVMCGFVNIDVIDLDIIDVSNLNRQFLFRPEHVNQPKSTVAAASAMAFNPDAQIMAYHQNIKDPCFNVTFFSKYSIVLNALDNVDARRHVNRLCLASDVPLIESGTTGYVGQVMPIVKGEMECYECRPKMTPKVYPICTIRSTPDKPVHCIVWAKELFKLIFGNTSESMLYEAALGEEESVYMGKVAFPPADQRTDENIISHMSELITALFHSELNKQIGMNIYKTSSTPPVPLDLKSVAEGCQLAREVFQRRSVGLSKRSGWERQMWSDAECVAELIACAQETLSSTEGTDLLGSYVFDKDNKFAMRFVTAASNIRSRIFHIAPMTYHDAKGVAGNIIPAIASTNAIIAGLQVAQAIRMLTLRAQGTPLSRENCTTTYCQRMPTRRGYYLQPTKPDAANEGCYVCNSTQQRLEIDTTKVTLQEFVDNVLKKRLGLVEPSVMIGASVIYEEGEDMDDSLQTHTACSLEACPGGGIKDDVIVLIEDFRQDLSLSLLVKHIPCEAFDDEVFPEKFRVSDGKEPLIGTISEGDIDETSNTSAEEGGITSVLGKKRLVREIENEESAVATSSIDAGDVVVNLE